MSEEKTAQIAKLAMLPDQIEALVADLPAQQLTTHYLPDEWTVAQNVHHLADSHMNSYIRCKLMTTEEHPMLRSYDQDRWADLPDASTADLTASLALLRSLHERWVVFWEGLSDEEWQRTGQFTSGNTITLEKQLDLYVWHGEAHIDQITRTLAAGSGI
jgi:hypothetical protein